MPKSDQSIKGSLLIVSALLIWSSQGIIIRSSKTPVVSLIFYSLIAALFLQSIILLRAPVRKALPPARGLFLIFALGAFSLINTLTYYYAYIYTSISNAVFTHYIAPVVVMTAAPFFLKERITVAGVFSIALASLGLWIIMRDVSIGEMAVQLFTLGTNSSSSKVRPDTVGILCGLASGAAYGGVIIILKILSGQYDKYVVVFIQNLFVVIVLLPFAGTIPNGVESIRTIVVIGIIYSTAATYLYYSGMAYVGANKAAILGYIEPIGAISFGALLLAEYPDRLSLLGGLLILSAGYVIITKG